MKRELSPREREIVQLISLGYSYDNIAATLKISNRTARFHTDNAKRKLRALTLPHLVALYLEKQYDSTAHS